MSIAGQLVQQWLPSCNFLLAQYYAACSMGVTSSLEANPAGLLAELGRASAPTIAALQTPS